MPRFLRRSVFLLSAVFAAILAADVDDHRRQLFTPYDAATAESVFACINHTALRLFNAGNRVGLICYQCGRLENTIIRRFMDERAMVVSDRPMQIVNRRAVSYVVFANEMFTESRRQLLEARGGDDDVRLRTTQFLFVSAAAQETVLAFATDLWRSHFRDVAFVTLNSSSRGTIQVPTMRRAVNLRFVGRCSPFGNDLERIAPYSSDFYRFCERQPCTLFHGAVADDTVLFWRDEDQLKLSETDGYEPMGVMLIERFTSFYGIEAFYVDVNLTWPEAARKLRTGELDIVVGLMPENLAVLEGLQVVCWYRDRTLTFTARVRRRLRDYPVLQLLTPLHYSVWICTLVVLLFYVLLLCALRKLADMGLIEERLELLQVYEIVLGQGVDLPRKMSLRAILALWMIFSLNLSILYNGTFTSSLADQNTEDLLKNLTDLRDSGMPLCGPPIVQKFLSDSDDPVVVDLRGRYRVMKRAEEAFGAIMSNNTMGVVQHVTVDRMNWATRTNRSQRIYTLPEPVLTFPILFYTRAEHPYRVPFERVVTEYRDSGLLYMWVKYYVIDEDKQIANSRDEDEDGVLSMDHLRPVFHFFFICQSISVLLLFVELFKFHFDKTPPK